jgi:hypothetical protein
MKQTSSRTDRYARKEIHDRYGFMLERGYEVVSVEDVPAGWQAALRKTGLVVKLYWARGEEDVSFWTDALPPDEFFGIGSVVYAVTGEKIPLKSYDDLSGELRKYLDTIEKYFQSEPVNMRDSLKAAQEQYHAELISGAAATAEAVHSKEQKRIPILHYPLLAVVLLLLFGVLTTLYMVLLERLPSFFSTEADFFTPYVGVGAALLAVFTLLLLRRWIKWS